MKVGTGLSDFSQKYSNRYMDVGIAEQHAITYAAGISASNILPIVAIYSTFIQRAYDQIIHDIAIQKLPIVICMDRSGLVGPDGPTHHGIFDIVYLRTIPNMIVTSPKDGYELNDLLFTALQVKKMFSIRYGKVATDYNENYKPKLLNIGKWEELIKGDDIVILSVGSMVESSLNVSEKIKINKNVNIGVVNCRFIKPLDENMLDDIYAQYDYIYTIEEGAIKGGFGSSILEYYSNKKKNDKIIRLLGIHDNFIDHGSRKELLDLVNLSEDKIYNIIMQEHEE